jgi:hypothetical protein
VSVGPGRRARVVIVGSSAASVLEHEVSYIWVHHGHEKLPH